MSAPGPLEGRRVLLRPPTESDVPLLSEWYRDPELVAPFDRFAVDTPEGLAESLRHAPEDPASLAPRYLVVRREDGATVGCVGHYVAHPVLSILDVWYLIGDPSARGGGLGTEAVELLIGRLFATTAFERVGATCDVENLGSRKLLERLGLRREGTWKAGLYHHARWHDVAVFGITRPEWTARVPTARGSAPPASAPR